MIMGPRHLLPALLLFIALNTAKAQSAEELPALEENDNIVFPSESPSLGAETEGVGQLEPGSGTITPEIPEDLETTTGSPEPGFGSTTPEILKDQETTTSSPSAPSDTILCPEVCSCSTEDVDGVQTLTANCANKDLEELPTGLDPRITSLNFQGNQLTQIPKTISEFKKLQSLTASNNLITELAPGSMNELSELKILLLDNNKLLEYPQELKNNFFLTKLEEINLGGNDIRAEIPLDSFLIFDSLRTIILPKGANSDIEQLCKHYTNYSLETVCVDSCDSYSYECSKSTDLELSNDDNGIITWVTDPPEQATETILQDEQLLTAPADAQQENVSSEISGIARTIAMVDAPIEPVDTPTESGVSVGAATSSTATGGVDKGLVAIIVAGMIVIVAGISIKRNWGSIRKRFSSNPQRPATVSNTNGTPEEVPLKEKDKSPV